MLVDSVVEEVSDADEVAVRVALLKVVFLCRAVPVAVLPLAPVPTTPVPIGAAVVAVVELEPTTGTDVLVEFVLPPITPPEGVGTEDEAVEKT